MAAIKKTVKTFTVGANVSATCTVEIQADSFESAAKIAQGMKWSDFADAKEELYDDHETVLEWINLKQ